MNGAHDLGGMHGFGPVEIEKDEPVFHSQWERRMFALTLACGFHGKWNLDMSRYAREQMPPAEYLATTYYEHWLFGLQKLLVEQELVTAKELQSGHADAIAGIRPLVGPVRTERAVNPTRPGGCLAPNYPPLASPQ